MAQEELSKQEVVAAACRVIQEQIIGVMTTCDAQHRPHSRWMLGVTSDASLTTVLSLSARGAQKLDHLSVNPNVCWMFSDAKRDEVVTLMGTMIRLEHPNMAEPVWQRLDDAAKHYSMNLLSEPENLWFEGLETTITQVQYMAPSKGLTHPVAYDLA